MVELTSGKSVLRVGLTVWTMTLELAHLCGWQPIGPESGDGAEDGELSWQMRYSTSDGQVIGAQDASHLADALERAASSGQRAINEWRDGRMVPATRLHTPPDGFGWFVSDAGADHLRTLAAFLRRGAVRIR